jgi:hypothetical protein
MKADALRKANSELRKTITANRMAAGYSQYDDGSSQTSANFSSSDPEMKSASLGGPDAEVAAHGMGDPSPNRFALVVFRPLRMSFLMSKEILAG